MTPFQYQVLRYVHDRVTGEFVNVGVVLLAPQERQLRAQMLRKTQRVSRFFHDINGRRLLVTLRDIERQCRAYGQQIEAPLHFEAVESLTAITQQIICPNDAAWQWGPLQRGIAVSLDHSFTDLYGRLVEHYTDEPETPRPTDKDVWRQHYKKYFEKHHLTERLQPRTVATANDRIDFHQTWQNGALHCYEPVTFDLAHAESIKDKMYKWFGKLVELRTSRQELHVYLLTALPPDDRELNDLIRKKLESAAGDNITVDVVTEDRAEAFSRQVRKKMEAHS